MPSGVATIEAGSGGAPLLLVHGFTGSKADFAGQLEPLAAAGFHAVAPDLPGHGDSHPDGATFSFEAYADVVLELADDLGWDCFALLGHSMGGVVVQFVAFEAAERLTHLVLMDTTPGAVEIDPGLLDLAFGVVAADGMAALLEAQRAIGPSPLETGPGRRLREQPGWQEASDARFLKCSGEMYVAMARHLTSATDRSERLAAVIPDAKAVVVPGAGHSPQLENPSSWFEAVSEFLRS